MPIDPIGSPPPRPDAAFVRSAARPTPTPTRFSEVLSATVNVSTGAVLRGAEAAMPKLPGGALMAVSMRAGGGATPTTTMSLNGAAAGPVGGVSSSAEGPAGGGASVGGSTGTGTGITTGDNTGDVGSALAQTQQTDLYYLQVQEQMNAENRSFSTLSNVLKEEHDTAKQAIQNIHS